MIELPDEPVAAERLDPLEEVVGFRLRRLQGLFQAHWQQWFVDDDIAITPVQGGILLLIEENEGLSQVSLARLLRIEAPTLLQTLKPLLQKRLVQRKRSARDSRAFSLALTELGRRIADYIRIEAPSHENDLLSGLTQRERARLLKLLDKAIASGETALDIAKLGRSPRWRSPAKDPEVAAEDR